MCEVSYESGRKGRILCLSVVIGEC
uniref:Uncharacterized protein n=1 Tax=Arundo donax TaxID=35708 RepID=A0A0A9GYV1_ARUDO